MFLGEIIKAYRDEHGLSMQDFASLSKLSKPYISQLEKNKNPKTGDAIVPSPDTFQKVATAMGITFDDLIRMVDKNQPMAIAKIKKDKLPPNIITPAARPVPVLGTICAGDGTVAEENFSGNFFIDNTVQADYALRVNGDSMVEAEIYNGDMAFLRKDFEFRAGWIYAVVHGVDREASLKKVFRQEDKLILQPCNSDYSPIIADVQDCYIVGELVGVYHSYSGTIVCK